MADDVVELLSELQSLRADGSLSGDEFATAKRILLAGLDGGSSGPAVVGPSPVAGSAPVGAPDSVEPEPGVDAPGSVPAQPGPTDGAVRPYASVATAPTLGQPTPTGHIDPLVAPPSPTQRMSALPEPVPPGATASPETGGIRLTAPVLATVVAVLIVAVGVVAVVISSGTGSSGGVVNDGSTAQPFADAGGPVTEGEATAFVENYYSLLPGNTSMAFASLSPSLQEQSGGFESYREFYQTLDSVRVEASYIGVDGTLHATIIFTKTNGETTRESYRFTIGRTSGGYIMQAANRG
ncbi:MAG: hypothetical protein L0I76_32680 [Pseudonocardia sp.]|nr:hypothetical protein [Pseudonocardia sp.]